MLSRLATRGSAILVVLASTFTVSAVDAAPLWQEPGEPGGPGLGLLAAKVLTSSDSGPSVVDRALLLLRDGRIEALAPASELELPEGYVLLDLGSHWIVPGMIDLHTHVAGSRDINDMVLQTNEGLRVSASVVPQNGMMEREVRAGVTTVLFIPGSGTNMGGQGVLLKTGLDTYEEMLVRDPGSLKIAQGDNPTRWGYGMGRSLMNFHIRTTVRKGLASAEAYAAALLAHEEGRGPRPEANIQFQVFNALADGSTQVSTHTQVYQLVMNTIRILKGEFGLDVYIDHGEWGAFRNAPRAQEMGVAAICGPRIIDTFASSRADTDGKITSVPGEYQRRGLELVGFNTDAPVVPGEELPLQAAMGARYGMDTSALQHVRGMTIVPARVAGIDHRVGSIEAGKDADLVVVTGDPSDPRNGVEWVLIEGQTVYRASKLGGEDGEGPRRW